MIRRRLNLICAVGHRHYSPTPDAFVGRSCQYPLEIGSTKKRCNEELRRLPAPKAVAS